MTAGLAIAARLAAALLLRFRGALPRPAVTHKPRRGVTNCSTLPSLQPSRFVSFVRMLVAHLDEAPYS